MKKKTQMNHKFNIGDRVQTIPEFMRCFQESYEGYVIISERVKQDTTYGGRPEVIIVTILMNDGKEKWANQDWFELCSENTEKIIENAPDFPYMICDLYSLL